MMPTQETNTAKTATSSILDTNLDIHEQLEKLRERLLDLSNRNTLLNFRHTASRSVRFVDELPNILFERLLDGKKFYIQPIPSPSEKELRQFYQAKGEEVYDEQGNPVKLTLPKPETWASYKGINISYDLPELLPGQKPAFRHKDNKLQTLLYPQQLLDRLKRMRSDARSAREERGVNMLFLALGFLQWKEKPDSDKSYLAPLILLPVNIEEDKSRLNEGRFYISLLPEDLTTNISLKMRLERDFGILLPDFSVDDNGEFPDPEEYFARVAEVITKTQPTWKVRRMATLGFFQFQRLMLYQDLDPDSWPDNALINSPLVRATLGHKNVRSGLPALAPEENDIELELVDVADSSQAQAIKAALSGCNLVIQGPPGTGKSQTITNLIAAFLAKGKRVLFLSEKMAALEVVYRRLQKLGLADFCLELHSHNTRRQSIIKDIARRLQLHRDEAVLQRHNETDFVQRLADLKQVREELATYIAVLQEETSLQEPVHKVLGTAGQAKWQLAHCDASLPELLEKLVDEAEVEALNAHDVRRLEQQLSVIAEIYERLKKEGYAPQLSAWRGVSSKAVVHFDYDELHQLATTVRETLTQLQASLDRLQNVSGIRFSRVMRDVLAMPRAAHETLQMLALAADFYLLWQHAHVLRHKFALPLPGGWEGVRVMRDVIALGRAASPDVLANLSPVVADRRFGEVVRIVGERVQALQEQQKELAQIFAEPEHLNESVQRLRDTADILANAGWLSFLDSDYRQARRLWQALIRPGRDKGMDNNTRARLLRSLADFLEKRDELRQDTALVKFLGDLFQAEHTDITLLQKLHDFYQQALAHLRGNADLARALLKLTAEHWAQLAEMEDKISRALRRLEEFAPLQANISAIIAVEAQQAWQQACHACLQPPWRNWAASQPISEIGNYDELKQAAAQLQGDCEAFQRAWQQFCAQTELDEVRWSTHPDGMKGLDLTRMDSLLENLLKADVHALERWLYYDRHRQDAAHPQARALLNMMEQEQIPAQTLPVAWRYVVYSHVARQLYRQHPTLQRLDHAQLDRLRDKYVKLDADIMRARRDLIIHRLLNVSPPAGERGPYKKNWTELALLEHEAGKKRRHLPLRRILAQAGEATQMLLPCFMMSPLSMAQYLPAGKITFDVLIMDEASQLRPEVCISALARCQQAIVVGDDKQMPPTSFFERQLQNDADDDEKTLAEDAESILDLTRTGFDEAVLRWHYRSRHESLIRFSNHKFYDGQLIVFPSPRSKSERYGVRLYPVADGVYDNQVNEREAWLVAQKAVEALKSPQAGTVGVVAMNKPQQDRIESIFYELAYQDPVVRRRLEKLEESGEPFFIKNLENVQGDERDTVIISLTYGPSVPGGSVLQRFGPINRDMGWRRLNVLFTRARERVWVYSSMQPADIRPDGNRGRQVLKEYLIYAQSGELVLSDVADTAQQRAHEPESPLEEAVLEVLRAHGYEAVPQVGVDGFYIDIGVRHPKAPDTYLLGIECDGASYHSGFYARDHDRIRQEHLEHLGWRIYRIWSRDWFINPQKEAQRLLTYIKELL
jgi:very-short-patch-repair endonuclease